MLRLPRELRRVLRNQGAVIVSTLDARGLIHSSCKGIVEIEPKGRIYLLDLYLKKTFANLRRNSAITITLFDEHKFTGYCLKGKGRILKRQALPPKIIRAWENKINSRISQRIIKNIHGEEGHPRQPEVLLPKPQYMIAMEVKEIVDLTPSR